MIVCIAEKPSVAKEIAEVLGARSRHDGYFEGNGYQVTWTFGHLCTLKEPHDYTPMWQRWNLSSLPMIPPRFGIKLIDDRGIEKQFSIIERIMKNADMIVNCGDAGQEGELIQRWVMQKAQAKCPVKRLWVSSLTEEAIREGFANLKDQSEYQPLYEAGLSRAIGDWLLGMNATRLYTLKYGKNRQVLSIGRVQTPTLALIVKRQHEIDNFVPQQYWLLRTLYRNTVFNAILRKSDDELMAEIEKQKEKAEKKGQPFDVAEAWKKAEAANAGIEPIASEEQGTSILDHIMEEPFTVTSVEKKEGKELPPPLFDLGLLQGECDRKYGIPIDVTLQTIQSLYEKKVTTYPRVDTTYLSDDIYPKCANILKGLRDYQPLTLPLMDKPLPKSKKVFDNKKVTDHHAIIPTGVYPQGLTDIEKKVYDLIARRFIAVFYPECKFNTTTVQGESAGIAFKTSGKTIIEQGWRVVFAGEPSDDKEEKELTTFVVGESGPHTPELVEKWTQPPKPYTEGTLVRAMETAGKFVDDEELRDAMKENGIGRPATRAEIIKTLYKRNYIQKVKKNIAATPTGIELIATIRNELLKSAELTGRWEKKLRDIEKRQYDAKTFIAELKEMLQQVVNDVLRDNSTIGIK
ncbi:MAG: DNA topoisomerase 3 [Bacteroidaceae bacterium]|nr:DNA topoisomerase 3 [Bacteroidaceae bacterium]